MSDLPADTRAFLERAKQTHRSTEQDRERVRVALRAALAVPPPGAVNQPAKSPAPFAKGASASVTKLLLGAAIAVASGAAVLSYAAHRRVPLPAEAALARPRAPSASSPALATAAPLAPRALEAPTAAIRESVAALNAPSAQEPTRRPRNSEANRNAPPAASVDSPTAVGPAPPTPALGDEMRLIRDANAALGRGEPGTAMQLLAEHARAFPDGALRQEREATQVLALCALGRIGQAHASAEALLRESGKSPYADRVHASCAYAKPTAGQPTLAPDAAASAIAGAPNALPEP